MADGGDGKLTFSASHARGARFESGGLRSCFEYRDLGIAASTGGRVMAQVIRARKGADEGFGWHEHVLDFQMFYVLKGWIRFAYEGVGEVLCEAGSCVHQPPGIRHAELGHSDDLELIEITLPAEFETREFETLEAAAPAETSSAAAG